MPLDYQKPLSREELVKNAAMLIIERRKIYSDEELDDRILKDFDEFCFGFCQEVDSIILGEEINGGYWRKAYNWPVVGSIIDGRAVKQSGFFTFAY